MNITGRYEIRNFINMEKHFVVFQTVSENTTCNKTTNAPMKDYNNYWVHFFCPHLLCPLYLYSRHIITVSMKLTKIYIKNVFLSGIIGHMSIAEKRKSRRTYDTIYWQI